MTDKHVANSPNVDDGRDPVNDAGHCPIILRLTNFPHNEVRRKIYTSEIPCFRMEMTPNMHFPAKVTIRSRVEVLNTIRKNLNENELMVFRRYGQIGHFIDFAEKWEFSGQLMHYLVQRKLKTKKKNEIWFAIGGKPLRFSVKEFVLVSGLKTGSLPSDEELRKVTKNNNLRDTIFGERARVTIDILRNKFVNMSSHKRSKKKVRIAFVYMLAGFLMAQDPKKIIDPFYFQIVSDLELFDRYPWGHMCFELTLDYLKIDFKAKSQERQKKNKTTIEKWNFYGCPHIFQAWAFEAIPKLGEVIVNRVNVDMMPRCLQWESTNIVSSKSLRIKDILKNPELTVVPIFEPSDEERQQGYYAGLRIYDDVVDDTIDRLTELLSGGVIICNDQVRVSQEHQDVEREAVGSFEQHKEQCPLPTTSSPHMEDVEREAEHRDRSPLSTPDEPHSTSQTSMNELRSYIDYQFDRAEQLASQRHQELMSIMQRQSQELMIIVEKQSQVQTEMLSKLDLVIKHALSTNQPMTVEARVQRSSNGEHEVDSCRIRNEIQPMTEQVPTDHRETEPTDDDNTVVTPLIEIHDGVTAIENEDEIVSQPGCPRARKRGRCY